MGKFRFGAVLDDKLMMATAPWMAQKIGVVAVLGAVPDGIEVCRREGARANLFMVIHFLRMPQHVAPPRALKPLLGGGGVSSVDLPA